MQLRHYLIAATLNLIAGIAHAADMQDVRRYANEGFAAIRRGDWQASMQAYCTAAKLADSIPVNVDMRTIMSYECGRALGATCAFDQAESYLMKSLKMGEEEKIGLNLRFPLFELGRLNASQAKYDQAIAHYKRALDLTESSRSVTKDPIGLADLLDEFAEVLRSAGQLADATQISKRSADIRSKNPTLASRSDPTPYGRYCASK